MDLGLYEGFVRARQQERRQFSSTAVAPTAMESNPFQNISMTGKFWWGGGRAEFYAQQLLPLIDQYGTRIHLIPAQQQPGELNDNCFHRKLMKHLPEGCATIYDWKEPEQYLDVLSRMDFHIGNRLHSIILAEILGVPSIGIGGAGGKIDNFIQKTQMLSDRRRVEFMEPISLERFELIRSQYQHPLEFIQAESQSAQTALEQVLGLSLSYRSSCPVFRAASSEVESSQEEQPALHP